MALSAVNQVLLLCLLSHVCSLHCKPLQPHQWHFRLW